MISRHRMYLRNRLVWAIGPLDSIRALTWPAYVLVGRLPILDRRYEVKN